MNPTLPSTDDTQVWDAWLSLYQVPALTVALETGILTALDTSPATPDALALRENLNPRVLRALLPMLKQLGFLVCHGGVFQLTELGRAYMLPDSPFFWGGVFTRIGSTIVPHTLLKEALTDSRGSAGIFRPVDGWEKGSMDAETGRQITAFYHSHSQAAAIGMTRRCDFSGIGHLLDVGGGSACFSIALARAFPGMRCTVMDLETICGLAQRYIAEAGAGDRVGTIPKDMFREDWPTGMDIDAVFFSNIFHDWNFETCEWLASKAFDLLPSGGCVLLHEMLLDDDGNGPLHAVAFSLLMAMATQGQQFTFQQLRHILEQAGFIDISVQPSHGYYSLVRGFKP